MCVWREGWENKKSTDFSVISLLLLLNEKSWRSWLHLCVKINRDFLQEVLPCSPVRPCTVAFCKSCWPTKCDFFFFFFTCGLSKAKIIHDVNNTKLERSAGGRMDFSLLGKWLSPLMIVILPSTWGILSVYILSALNCTAIYLHCFCGVWFVFFSSCSY